MIALYIILAVLAFIILLLSLPVGVYVQYSSELIITIRYLFIKKNIDLNKAEEKEEIEKVEQDTEKEIEKISPIAKLKKLIKNIGAKEFLEIVKQLTALTSKSFLKILKRVNVKLLDVYFLASEENAAETALLYGKACAIVYPAVAELANITSCKKYTVTVDANYQIKKSAVDAKINIKIHPIFVVGQAICLLLKALPYLNKLRKGQG